MKRAILILTATILMISTNALSDVKIKSKQTLSGQTTENTTFIKGKRTRSEMMGGAMITVTQCDLGRDLQIAPQTKTYTINYYDNADANPGEVKPGDSAPVTKGGTMFVTTTIKDTGERKQMFGFTARHIIQTIVTETSPDACNPFKSKMEMESWVIDAEFGQPCAITQTYTPNYGSKSGGCQDKVVAKTIGSGKSGYPLWQKMTSFDANGKESFSTIQEVVEISKATLDQSLFELPDDYREVKSSADMYASGSSGISYKRGNDGGSSSDQPSGGLSSGIRKATASRSDSPASIGAKKAGTVRIGLSVKTAAVGDGINAADMSSAIQNSLGDYVKGTKIEIVPLEAKLATAQTEEAKQKECDFVLSATASHKKGGGGFGFGKIIAQTVGQTGIGGTGSTAGNIAGQVATTTIVSAASMSGSVKSKDELTLDLKMQSVTDNSSPLSKQFKAKAKSDGDDIITAVIEQAAQAILDAVGK